MPKSKSELMDDLVRAEEGLEEKRRVLKEADEVKQAAFVAFDLAEKEVDKLKQQLKVALGL